HPGVGHGDVEVDLTALVADLHVDGVGEVEATLGLDDVGEQADDIAVLPVELQLHLGLVLLQVLRAHRASRAGTVASSICCTGPSSPTSGSGDRATGASPSAPTPSSSASCRSSSTAPSPVPASRQDRRWCRQGPCCSRAAVCS